MRSESTAPASGADPHGSHAASSDASKVVSGQLFYLANGALWTYCISWSMRTLYVSYRVISISSSQFNYYVVVS